ncbi:serine hydrolase [Ideonella margarita]|uniref:Serine hydrolase n=1 Tax=Ideonella margarita TaxID=2984191 RepID=A0ABU9C751_9BURK
MPSHTPMRAQPPHGLEPRSLPPQAHWPGVPLAVGMLSLSAWCALGIAPAHAQAPSPTPTRDARIQQVENGLLPAMVNPQTVPMRLSDRMRALNIPGLSVAVVDRGQLVWAHAWGTAQPGVVMTPETVLQAASISKPVSAVAALQAVDQGRLGLDTDLTSHLRTWPLPAGAQTADKPVTLRRLLSHNAGFTVSGFNGYLPSGPVPTVLQVLDGLPPANSAAVRVGWLPGSERQYSGGGYTVLQQLLEDVYREPFAAWMQQAVLGPAGMTHSFFAPPGPLTPLQMATAAMGHQRGQMIEGGYRIHPELAAAGLWTTPSDLARFNLALPRLLRPATLAEALRLQSERSGLGFVIDPLTGRYGHDGGNAGFESRWLASPEDGGRAVVLMANSNDAIGLMNEVVRAIATAHGWTRWMPATQASVTETLTTTPMFVRGSLNDWGTGLALQKVAPGRYAGTTQHALPVGRVEFKIASGDWDTVDLGGASGANAAAMTLAQPTALNLGGSNLVFDVPQPGRYRFELDTTSPTAIRLRITRVAGR